MARSSETSPAKSRLVLHHVVPFLRLVLHHVVPNPDELPSSCMQLCFLKCLLMEGFADMPAHHVGSLLFARHLSSGLAGSHLGGDSIRISLVS